MISRQGGSTQRTMASLTLVLELLVLVSAVSSWYHYYDYYGGSVTFTPKGQNPDGTYVVELRNKQTNYYCTQNGFRCHSGNCGTETKSSVTTISQTSYSFHCCHREVVTQRKIYGNKPFEIRYPTTYNYYGQGYWRPNTKSGQAVWNMAVNFDLGTRSDTGESNRPPTITSNPPLRITQNCPRRYSLPVFDHDGDQVRCRFGASKGSECSLCYTPEGFSLDQNSCTLSYAYTRTIGLSAFELMVEDFPTQHITVSYSDGSYTFKSPSAGGRHRRDVTTNTTLPLLPFNTTATVMTTTAATTTTTTTAGTTTETATTTGAAISTATSAPATTTTGAEITTATSAPATTTTGAEITTATSAPATTTTGAEITTATSAPATTTTGAEITTATSAPATTTTGAEITTATSAPATTTTGAEITTATSAPATTTTGAEITTATSAPATTTTGAAISTATSAPATTTTGAEISTATSAPATTTTGAEISTATSAPATTTTGAEITTATSAPATTTTGAEITTATSAPATTSTEAAITAAPTASSTAPSTITTSTSNAAGATSTSATTATTTTTTTTATSITAAPSTTTTTTAATTSTLGTTTRHYLPSIPPLSKLPLQFTIYVDAYHAASCLDGDYFPIFLSPTPRNGVNLLAFVNHTLEIRVRATAKYTSIYDLIVSGPAGTSKHKTSTEEFTIKWTPTENEVNDHFAFCFFFEARDGHNRVYQSELRCVVADVGHHDTTVHCSTTKMKVEVEKSYLIRRNEKNLHLKGFSDAACSLKKYSNTTHLVAIMSLNSCGTTLEEDGDNLVFKNEITSADPNDVISRQHDVEIVFSCVYPKRTNLTLGFKHKNPYAFTEKGFGAFTFQFEFFESQRFRKQVDASTYPVEVDLKQMIFMQIEATTSIPNTELFVESCRATPYDNPNSRISYTIIENGCVKDRTVQIFPGSKAQFRFGMEAFEFIGAYAEVYITCSVILCENGFPGTRCSQGCIRSNSGSHRGKREAVAQSSSHSISQGPLHLVKTSDSKVSVPSLNLGVNVMLFASCLLVCGVVVYHLRRSRAKYQLLPSVEAD